ncbi:hypothetical protein A2U01_0077993, partial [Trifolium medium]|nr:hypothetical protein [Trifolium medium]
MGHIVARSCVLPTSMLSCFSSCCDGFSSWYDDFVFLLNKYAVLVAKSASHFGHD